MNSCIYVIILAGVSMVSVKSFTPPIPVFLSRSTFCQMEYLKGVQVRPETTITWRPQCNTFGWRWNIRQCDSSMNCWCVNTFTGTPLTTHTHKYGTVDCGSTLRKCSRDKNQEFRYCTTSCKKTCSNLNENCLQSCSPTQSAVCYNLRGFCPGQCTCPEGLVEHDSGVCVPVNQCPPIVSDTPTCRAELNETYLECPTSQTDGTCADPAPREKRLRSCTPRCGCKEGEVRNNDGVCVEYARCFSFEECRENQEYLFCGSRCPATCNDPFPKCTKECYVGCFCVAGYILASKTNQTCVPYARCSSNEEPEEEESNSISSNTSNKITESKNLVLPNNNQNLQAGSNKNSTDCERERDEAIIGELFDAFIPTCDREGLYESKQCYGYLLECWCVDKFSGKELDGSRAPQFDPEYHLDCDNYEVPPPPSISSRSLIIGESQLPPLPDGDNLTPEELERFLEENFMTACELERTTAIDGGVNDAFVPSCEESGLFKSKQCYDLLNECWCVNITNGFEIEGSRASRFVAEFPHDCNSFIAATTSVSRSETTNVTTTPSLTTQESDQNNEQVTSVPPVDTTPLVETNATETVTTSSSGEREQRSNKNSTDCERERDEAINGELFDAFIPTCDREGLYESKQCYGYLLECWCVDKFSGKELDGSRAPQFDPEYHLNCDNYEVPPPPQSSLPSTYSEENQTLPPLPPFPHGDNLTFEELLRLLELNLTATTSVSRSETTNIATTQSLSTQESDNQNNQQVTSVPPVDTTFPVETNATETVTTSSLEEIREGTTNLEDVA